MSIITVSQQQLLQSSFTPTANLDFILISPNLERGRVEFDTGRRITGGVKLDINLSFDRKLNSLINSIKTAKEPFIKSLLNSFKFKTIVCETFAKQEARTKDFFSYQGQPFSLFLNEETREQNFISHADHVNDTTIYDIESFSYDPAGDIYRLKFSIFIDKKESEIEYLSILHGFYIDPLAISQQYSLSAPIANLGAKGFFSSQVLDLKIINGKKYENLEKTVEMNYIEELIRIGTEIPNINTTSTDNREKNPYFSNLFANFSEFSYRFYSKTVSFTFLKYAFFFDADRWKIEKCAFPEIAKAFGDEERRRFLGSGSVSTANGFALGSFYRKRVDIPNQPEELIGSQLNIFSETKDYKVTINTTPSRNFYEFINDKLTSLDGIYFFSGIDSLNKEKTETGSAKKITAGTYQYKFLGTFNDPIYIILQDLLNKLQNDKKTLSEYLNLARIPERYQNIFFESGKVIDNPHVVDNIFTDGYHNPITNIINTRLSDSYSSKLDTSIENYIKVWLLIKNINSTEEQKNNNKEISSKIRRTLKFAIKPGTGSLNNLNKFINAHDKLFAILKERYNSKSKFIFPSNGFPGTNPIRIEENFRLEIKADIKEHFGFKFLNENNLNHRYGVPQVDFNAIKTNIPLNSVYFADDRKPQEVTIDLISTITTGSATDLDNKILKNIKRDNVTDKTAVLSFKADAINLAKTNNLGRSSTNNKAYDKQFKKEADTKTNNQVFASVIKSYQAIVLGSDAYTKLSKDTSVVVKYYSFGRDTITGEYILKDARLNVLTAEQPNGKYFCILDQSGSFPRDYTGAPIFDKYFIVDKK